MPATERKIPFMHWRLSLNPQICRGDWNRNSTFGINIRPAMLISQLPRTGYIKQLKQLKQASNFWQAARTWSSLPSENQTWQRKNKTSHGKIIFELLLHRGFFQCLFFSRERFSVQGFSPEKSSQLTAPKSCRRGNPFAPAVPNWFHVALGLMDLPGGARGGDVTWKLLVSYGLYNII